jgi:hypothetical protein
MKFGVGGRANDGDWMWNSGDLCEEIGGEGGGTTPNRNSTFAAPPKSRNGKRRRRGMEKSLTTPFRGALGRMGMMGG